MDRRNSGLSHRARRAILGAALAVSMAPPATADLVVANLATPEFAASAFISAEPSAGQFAGADLQASTFEPERLDQPLAARPYDPVVVDGEALGGEVFGHPISAFLLLAWSDVDRALVPIPFQIDERGPKGNLIINAGPKRDEDQDRGEFDANDELVFLARDSGRRAAHSNPGGEWIAELRVSDPSTGGTGWVYLVRYLEGRRPALSPVRYVQFDSATGRITTAAYHMRFTDPLRPFTPTWTSAPGPDGDVGVDFLDTLKVRLSGKLFGLTQVEKTDMDFESKDRGYTLGAVRLTRVMETSLRLIGRLKAPGAGVTRIYYPDWIEAPIPISLPFKITSFFGSPDVFFGSDFNLPRDGSHRYYSEVFPEGLAIGSPEPGPVGIDVASPPPVPKKDVAWHGVAGPLGAMFSTVALPESVPVEIQTVFELSDAEDQPEDIRGASPLVGRRLVGWEEVRRGRHVGYFNDYFPIDYRPGDERQFLRMLHDPLEVDVSRPPSEILASPSTEDARAAFP